jgi:DNA-binding CsgD family transcriptional regulator
MVKTKSGVLVPVNPGKVLFSDDDWRRIGLILKLSRRELQVARLTAEYQRRKNIARRLGLSPHTISTIAERVFRKLRVTGQVPLVLNFVWLQQAVQV